MTLGGYNDWFIPSKDELNLMYINLKAVGLTDFALEDYWSSSENDVSNTWFQYFDLGSHYFYDKDYYAKVRVVRYF